MEKQLEARRDRISGFSTFLQMHRHFMKISDLSTPAALIDNARMERNISRMQMRMNRLGVSFRPHVKTSKCVNVTQAQIKAGARGITVSTLKEAEQFFAAGITDILYAVGITANKLPQALALLQKGCDLKILTDSVQSAAAISAFGIANNIRFKVMIEIDTDDHRSGIKPESPQLLGVAQALAVGGAELFGVMTHAGSSYDLNTPEALEQMAEQERAGCVRASQRLREAGFQCPVVSVGSTPTALSASQLEGVTEVRAGVYVFFDLVMHNVGVCATDDIALSVLTTVIGHQEEKGWIIVDAGWMAMSRDRGTQKQTIDFGYGQVCNADGEPLSGYMMTGANQEHGIISRRDEPDLSIAARFPVGTQLRLLPNHACATAAQFPEYQVLTTQQNIQTWPRFYGW
jgi:D-serine deaminase-like pyridoxal phosphate-dependent protein